MTTPIGIDLGTTNCALAYVDTKGRERPPADIRPFHVPQLVAPGETAPRPTLPSFLYLPGGPELPPGAALTVLATDPIAKVDIPLYCAQHGHACDIATDETGLRFAIVKAGAPS